MGPVYVIALLVIVPGLLWGAISPRSQWRALSAWQYRNPDANEPSDLAYGLARLSNIVTLVIIVVVGFALAGKDEPEQRPSADRSPSPDLSTSQATLPPEPLVLGPLPLAGYQVDPQSPRGLNVVVYGGPPAPWWCKPELDVTAQTASQVVLKAVMVNALSDTSASHCKLVSTTRIVDQVSLDKPLGKRVVVTKGPVRGTNGTVLPAGAVRRLPVVAAKP